MLKQTKNIIRLKKGTGTPLITPPLLVLHTRADLRTSSPRYEVEVQLTSSWEANLGLAGGDLATQAVR